MGRTRSHPRDCLTNAVCNSHQTEIEVMWKQVRREKCRTRCDKKPGDPKPYPAAWTSNRNRSNDENQKPQSEIDSRRVMPALCLVTRRNAKRPQQTPDCFT